MARRASALEHKGEAEAGLRAYDEAIAALRPALGEATLEYGPGRDLALALANSGINLARRGHGPGARARLEEAEAFLRTLAARFPDRAELRGYLDDVGRALEMLR